MTHPPPERLRAYGRAEADVTARLLMEAHLCLCSCCSASVAEYQRVRGHLPEATLHDELDLLPFDRVWTAVKQARVALRRPREILPPSILATLPPSGRWRLVAVWPAPVKVTVLIRDADTRTELRLYHWAPGSTLSRHRHLGLEENVILVGGYHIGDIRADAGDWVVGACSADEVVRAEDQECWYLSRVERPGVHFTRWRRGEAP